MPPMPALPASAASAPRERESAEVVLLRRQPQRTSAENGEGRNRTGDTTVFSRVLYRLSYLAALRSVARSSLGPAKPAARLRLAPRAALRFFARGAREPKVLGLLDAYRGGWPASLPTQ